MNSKDAKLPDTRPAVKRSRLSRREMIQQAMIAAVFLPGDFQRSRGRQRSRASRTIDPSQIPPYKYRILSVNHFPSLQKEYDTARNVSWISHNENFRNQIAPLGFKLPSDFPNARSVVVMAAHAKNMYANFHLDGDSYRIMIPFQYYNDDLNAAGLKEIIQRDIIKTPDRRIVDISQEVPLKLLAARSGLGRYARNGLVFVDGMGSYNLLYAFLTDHSFDEDSWVSLQILDQCNHCHACERTCPTNCISRRSFSVDIDKCLTLYNENPGGFPNYILGSMHHALMGCMKCNAPCPINEGIAELSGNMEDVTEEETRKIIRGTPDEALLKSLQRKLRQFPAAVSIDQFPVLKRNLSALIRV